MHTEPADYPAEWTSDQRLNAYWYALDHNIVIDQTPAWNAVLARAENQTQHRHAQIDELRHTNIIKFPKRKQSPE